MPQRAHSIERASIPNGLDLQQVFEQHAPFVRALAQQLVGPRADADDVAQEVFVLAWRKAHAFHGGDVRAWLSSMTVKLAAAARRRAWWRRTLGLDHAAEQADPHNPEESATVSEAHRIFNALIAKMPEKRRAVFVLYEIHGFTSQETAEALGCSVEAVRTRLFRARREFLSHFEREGLGEPPAAGADRA